MKTPPDGKVHGANMGPIWGRQDPGGPHVGPMIFDIWAVWGKDMHRKRKYTDGVSYMYKNIMVSFIVFLGCSWLHGTVETAPNPYQIFHYMSTYILIALENSAGRPECLINS